MQSPLRPMSLSFVDEMTVENKLDKMLFHGQDRYLQLAPTGFNH